MKAVENFYKDFGFIIGFLVGSLVIEMTFGEKVQYHFLLLVLFSMLILNSTNFLKFVDENLTLKTSEEKEKKL